MHGITAGLLLTKLNTGGRFFTLSELRDRDDDSDFDARREISVLLNEGVIRAAGDGRYKIIVDIYTLRKLVLKGEAAGSEPDETDEACGISRADIVNSVWRADPDLRDRERAERGAEEEELIRRREYLENRRRELMARLREETAESDEDDEDDEDDDCDADDEDDTDEHPLFDESGEQDVHKKLVALIVDEKSNSKLAVAALKLCASEGYVSPRLLCKTYGVDEDTAQSVCFWLYINDFIKRDTTDRSKYLPDIPEIMFFACCREAEERKNALGRLAGAVKAVSERRQRKELEERKTFMEYRCNFRLRKIVREKLAALVRTDLGMTRAKALTKAEGCLCAARDIGNDEAADVYEKVILELKNMSNYLFNRLKRRLSG